jgi:xanthine dehydrogenase accessory factor
VGSSADSIPDLDPGTQLQLKFLGHDLLQQNRGCTLQVLTDARGRKRRFLMDPVRPMDFDIYVFGAGHVGRALVQMLRLQSCRINWIETRDDQFPSEPDRRVQKLCTDTPEAEIAQAPENSFFVIMTHDHALDLRLTEAVLKRDDFAYLGLIGSRSKRLRFEHRLRDRGYKPYQLSRITCPIGIDDIRGKEPARVALAVTAQLVQIYEALDNQAENPVKLYSSA